MTKLPQILILLMISFSLLNCEQKKSELTDLEFEQKVFYDLFPELSAKMYEDIRLIPPPPPSSDYLNEKGFDSKNGYNKALEQWKKSDDYRIRLNDWKERRDSIINDTTLIYISFPDSINRFEREDMYELINHYNDQNLVVDSKDFQLESGFKVDFNQLKSDNAKLRYKPLSEFPAGREFWMTKYNFNFKGSLSFSRILFDKTKSFGVLNAGFVKGRLNGSGCRIYIRKDEKGNWIVDKIKGTWVS